MTTTIIRSAAIALATLGLAGFSVVGSAQAGFAGEKAHGPHTGSAAYQVVTQNPDVTASVPTEKANQKRTGTPAFAAKARTGDNTPQLATAPKRR